MCIVRLQQLASAGAQRFAEEMWEERENVRWGVTLDSTHFMCRHEVSVGSINSSQGMKNWN
jgi:hypothetical protein